MDVSCWADKCLVTDLVAVVVRPKEKTAGKGRCARQFRLSCTRQLGASDLLAAESAVRLVNGLPHSFVCRGNAACCISPWNTQDDSWLGITKGEFL